MLPNDKIFDNMIAPNNGDLYESIYKQLLEDPNVFTKLENWEEISKYR